MNLRGLSGAPPYCANPSMTAGEISSPHLVSQKFAMPSFNSSGLSLGLIQSNMEGQMDMSQMMAGAAAGGRRNNEESPRRDENDSRSGSDNLEAVSDDDTDQEQNSRKKNKRYHRHTPQQIQELEALFKECPHPDEKQRMELSRRLSLESRQVKFWFQNRRTQMKTQIERHENLILRQENDKLRAENMSVRQAMRNPVCNNCSGPAMLGELSLDQQNLRIENARLKEELNRVCALAGKFLGRSVSSMASSSNIAPGIPNSFLELGNRNNGGFDGIPSVAVAPSINAVPDLFPAMANPLTAESERRMLVELALAAMEELLAMAQMKEPLWIPAAGGNGDVLNYEQYQQCFRRTTGILPVGYVSEASRDIGMVNINSQLLVEILMNVNQWAEMFSCIIVKATTTDIISSGVGESRNGALQLINAELQVLSPLVDIRKVNFLRFSKEHAGGLWAVVDISIDCIGQSLSSATSYANCRILPSGCVVENVPDVDGYSKVTWIAHSEYNEAQVHQLFRPLVRSGLAFGATRWLATLQRHCESLAALMSPSNESAAFPLSARRSMVKLAQRMTSAFCAGVCAASAAHEWSRLESDMIGENVRVMTRRSGVNDSAEPAGFVLSAATSVWIPMPPKRLFNFLGDAAFRSKWDILSNGGLMLEMVNIPKGQFACNVVSLLRPSAFISNQTSMLILQETCMDESGATIVYAPVDVPAMHQVMNGSDSSYVGILPSGFAVLPDAGGAASLLTIGFQILVSTQPPEEAVSTANGLISRTVQKIKDAINLED